MSQPLGSMAISAIALHEMFLSYIAAGFTSDQALQLVCVLLNASIIVNGPGGQT